MRTKKLEHRQPPLSCSPVFWLDLVTLSSDLTGREGRKTSSVSMVRLYLVQARQAFLPRSYVSKPRLRLHSEGLSSMYKALVLIAALRNKNKTPPVSSSPSYSVIPL